VADAGAAQHGDTVRVLTSRGRDLGFAFYSKASKIALRMVSGPGQEPTADFWAARLDRALAYRARETSSRDACRLVFGESDGFPGFVADRYREHLVVQAMTAATERALEGWLDLLGDRLEVRSVLARNDPAARRLEALSREVRQLRGTTPDEIEIREGSVRLVVDPWRGQKTGAFLDQADNRVAAASWARGRVLDVFCYQGAFALEAASRASEVVAVDISGPAIAQARRNASLNGVRNVEFVEANAFDELRARERRGEQFDLIFLDPPAFAKSRQDVPQALRGYKEINLRAMRLLAPDGILVSCSCSYHLSGAEFVDLLGEAAADARRGFRLLEWRTQARDHPIRLGFPESQYLKCLVLERT
jgi:23S rRNA (cytosine1962-C5)-methyltransferase